jgi:hypothetical protein
MPIANLTAAEVAEVNGHDLKTPVPKTWTNRKLLLMVERLGANAADRGWRTAAQLKSGIAELQLDLETLVREEEEASAQGQAEDARDREIQLLQEQLARFTSGQQPAATGAKEKSASKVKAATAKSPGINTGRAAGGSRINAIDLTAEVDAKTSEALLLLRRFSRAKIGEYVPACMGMNREERISFARSSRKKQWNMLEGVLDESIEIAENLLADFTSGRAGGVDPDDISSLLDDVTTAQVKWDAWVIDETGSEAMTKRARTPMRVETIPHTNQGGNKRRKIGGGDVARMLNLRASGYPSESEDEVFDGRESAEDSDEDEAFDGRARRRTRRGVTAGGNGKQRIALSFVNGVGAEVPTSKGDLARAFEVIVRKEESLSQSIGAESGDSGFTREAKALKYHVEKCSMLMQRVLTLAEGMTTKEQLIEGMMQLFRGELLDANIHASTSHAWRKIAKEYNPIQADRATTGLADEGAGSSVFTQVVNVKTALEAVLGTQLRAAARRATRLESASVSTRTGGLNASRGSVPARYGANTGNECWNCKKPGHMALACPLIAQQASKTGAGSAGGATKSK